MPHPPASSYFDCSLEERVLARERIASAPGRDSLPAFGVLQDLQTDPLPRLAEHVAQDPRHLVELRLAGDERGRDLDHGVAAIVGAADQPAPEELAGEEAAQEGLALLVREALAGLL